MNVPAQEFSGRLAIVTGAGGGIGAATASTLAERGAAVVVAELDRERGVAVADSLVKQGWSVRAISTDITDPSSVADLVAAALEWSGRIDILVNNAALTSFTMGEDMDIVRTETHVWDKTMAVNVMGLVTMCQAVLPSMLAAGSGAIVNVGSIGGLLPNRSSRLAYGTSKAAVHYISQHIAVTYGKQGIRCNAVAPGSTMTETFLSMMPTERITEKLTTGPVVLPYLCDPADVAATIAFLASDGARSITGQVLQVDGGAIAHKPG